MVGLWMDQTLRLGYWSSQRSESPLGHPIGRVRHVINKILIRPHVDTMIMPEVMYLHYDDGLDAMTSALW